MAAFTHLILIRLHVCDIAVNTALSQERPSTPMCVPAPWLPCDVIRVCKGPMCAPTDSTLHTWCCPGSPIKDPAGLSNWIGCTDLKGIESLGGFWEMLDSHGSLA